MTFKLLAQNCCQIDSFQLEVDGAFCWLVRVDCVLVAYEDRRADSQTKNQKPEGGRRLPLFGPASVRNFSSFFAKRDKSNTTSPFLPRELSHPE